MLLDGLALSIGKFPTCSITWYAIRLISVKFQIMAGDLNFRLNLRDSESVLHEIEKGMQEGSFDALVAQDELHQSISQGKVIFCLLSHKVKLLTGFQEAKIAFPPTFKLYKKEKGILLDSRSVCSVYQTKAKDGTQRIPAYTDRIVWHSLPLNADGLRPSSDYLMVEGIRKSDHRPVFVEFTLKCGENKEKDEKEEKESNSFLLQLKNVHVQLDNGEKSKKLKICCPLPCEETKWRERQVAAPKFCDIDDNSA